MNLFSGISADESADASADALCIIIRYYYSIWQYLKEGRDLFEPFGQPLSDKEFQVKSIRQQVSGTMYSLK